MIKSVGLFQSDQTDSQSVGSLKMAPYKDYMEKVSSSFIQVLKIIHLKMAHFFQNVFTSLWW